MSLRFCQLLLVLRRDVYEQNSIYAYALVKINSFALHATVKAILWAEMIFLHKNFLVLFGLAILMVTTMPVSRGDESIKQDDGKGNPVAGKEKSKLCQGCHGEDGNSISEATPKLSGQYEKYILKQLRDYKAGIRPHEIMNAMAIELSEEDMADVSSYFSIQVKMKGSGSVDTDEGEKLYLKGDRSQMVMACVSCHGVKGKGLTPDTPMYPVIGGQHKDYLLKQLIDYRENERANSQNSIMSRIVRPLSDGDLEALASYLAAQ